MESILEECWSRKGRGCPGDGQDAIAALAPHCERPTRGIYWREALAHGERSTVPNVSPTHRMPVSLAGRSDRALFPRATHLLAAAELGGGTVPRLVHTSVR
jgi:hypothetical protein